MEPCPPDLALVDPCLPDPAAVGDPAAGVQAVGDPAAADGVAPRDAAGLSAPLGHIRRDLTSAKNDDRSRAVSTRLRSKSVPTRTSAKRPHGSS